MRTLFFIEITDTFGGDANYSWVTRHVVRAKSRRGAVNALSRRSGVAWHAVGGERYDSKSNTTCAFIREYDRDTDDDCIQLDTDDRRQGE